MLFPAGDGFRQHQRRSLCNERHLLAAAFSQVLGRPQAQVAVKLQLAAARLQAVPPRRNLQRGHVVHRLGHLAGHRAAPNQLVQAELVARKGLAVHIFFQAGRRAGHVRRTDGLVGVLRALAAGIIVWLFRHVFRSVRLLHMRADGCNGLRRQSDRVGTHVRDETLWATAAQADAFVQGLRHAHGLFGRKAQPAARGLLQRTGGERRERVHLAVTALALFDHKFRGIQRGHGGVRFSLVMQLQLFAVVLFQLRHKERCLFVFAQLGRHRPELLRHKVGNFLFAVRNNLDRHGLHAAGTQPLPDLAPQQRTQLVTHNTVNNAACLLRVHHVHVDFARFAERRLHCVGRNFVELNAAGVARRQPQQVRQMPANRLALAIRVGCQIHFRGILRQLFQRIDQLALAANVNIFRFKVVFQIHPKGAARQVS